MTATHTRMKTAAQPAPPAAVVAPPTPPAAAVPAPVPGDSDLAPSQVREDLPHLIDFLSRVESSFPGYTVDEVLQFLHAASNNALALSMLTAALADGGTDGEQGA